LLPSGLWHCWLGGRKDIWPVKSGGWWRRALISGAQPDCRCVCLCYLPLRHKVQRFSSGSPGWSRKKRRKTVVVWCDSVCSWCSAAADLVAVEPILQSFLRVEPADQRQVVTEGLASRCPRERVQLIGRSAVVIVDDVIFSGSSCAPAIDSTDADLKNINCRCHARCNNNNGHYTGQPVLGGLTVSPG